MQLRGSTITMSEPLHRMPSRIALALGLMLCNGMAHPQAVAAPNDRLIVEPVRVVTSDSARRVERLAEASGQQFDVDYDDSGRPIAVHHSERRNGRDITAIGYEPDGRLIGVRVASGYELTFNYAASGAQETRDNLGNYLRRLPRGDGRYESLTTFDPQGRLARNLDAVTRLIDWLKASSRTPQ